jgi:hypothetical protein
MALSARRWWKQLLAIGPQSRYWRGLCEAIVGRFGTAWRPSKLTIEVSETDLREIALAAMPARRPATRRPKPKRLACS